MAAPIPPVRDPRIRRTRQLLQDGLRNLLHEKPLEEILVNDITAAATVNRATFYDHYCDKFDLFNAVIATDFQKLVEQRQVCLGEKDGSGLLTLVFAVSDFLQTVHADKAACTRRASAGPLIDSATTLAIRQIVLAGLQKHSTQPPDTHEVIASLISGAIYFAVKESLSQRGWKADEHSLRSVVALVLPLLTAGTSAPPPAAKEQ